MASKSKSDAPVARDEAMVPREETLPQRSTDAPTPPGARAESEARQRRWPWVVGIGAAVLLAVLLFTRAGQKKQSEALAAKAKAAQRAVPVAGATARKGDLDVYLTGLGTVTALNTVTVRSRVDGQLIRVHFREGQLVHEGDLLAEIDPRPFEVQLMQARGAARQGRGHRWRTRGSTWRALRILVDAGPIPKQQLDTQAATVNQVEAAVKSDQAQIEARS